MTKKQIESLLLENPGLIPTALRTIGRVLMTTSEHIAEYDVAESVVWFKGGDALHKVATKIEQFLKEQGGH